MSQSNLRVIRSIGSEDDWELALVASARFSGQEWSPRQTLLSTYRESFETQCRMQIEFLS